MTTEFVIELGLILLVVFAAALFFFQRLECATALAKSYFRKLMPD